MASLPATMMRWIGCQSRLRAARRLSPDIRLEHVATRSYMSGMVQSEYLIAT
ncbi:MAG: hypothetical protein ABI383_06685 [Acidobacteriaceae bacterium]